MKIPSAALLIPLLFSAAAPAVTPAWNGTVLGFEAPPAPLLGEMLGIRPILTNHGFNYQLGYLSQLAMNAGGGYNHDSHAAYIDQFSLTFTQDLERYTGIPDAQIEGNIVNRNHNDNLTLKRLQDNRVNFNDLAQESYGGQSITRLGWLTFARSFDQRRLTWRVGLMNKVQTFDQIIPCDFQMLTQCGGKSANSLSWNNWNVHTWGTTLSYRLTPALTLKGGIMEQNSYAADRSHAWSWSTKGSKGMLLPLELEARTHVNGLPGAYNLGVLFNNATRTDLYRAQAEYHRTWFLYSGLNQQVTQRGGDPDRGMSLSWSLGVADPRSTYIHYTTAASMRYRGLFDARPDDWLGLGVSYIEMSNHYARNQAYQNEVQGVTDYGNALYSPLPGHSINAELYYRFRPVGWLELQPGLQYWHHPGGVRETQDAWVTGLKTVISF